MGKETITSSKIAVNLEIKTKVVLVELTVKKTCRQQSLLISLNWPGERVETRDIQRDTDTVHVISDGLEGCEQREPYHDAFPLRMLDTVPVSVSQTTNDA